MAEEAVVLVWRELASGECTPEVLEGLEVCMVPQRCTYPVDPNVDFVWYGSQLSLINPP